eukprot:353242-Chlamydomonas_euryale.AAC.3
MQQFTVPGTMGAGYSRGCLRAASLKLLARDACSASCAAAERPFAMPAHTPVCYASTHVRLLCQHTRPSAMPAHTSVCYASTHVRLLCQHTRPSAVPAHTSDNVLSSATLSMRRHRPPP